MSADVVQDVAVLEALSDAEHWDAIEAGMRAFKATVEWPITGWRIWSVYTPERIRGVPGPKGAVLAQPLRYDPPFDRLEVLLDGAPRVSECVVSDHRAPAQFCQCGYRVVRRLADLVPLVEGWMEGQPVAFVPVEGWGVVRPATHPDDPRGTARVEHLAMRGPMIIAPSVARHVVNLERRYGVAVEVGRGTDETWLQSLQHA